VQTDHQARHKGDRTPEGWLALVTHVLTYTMTAVLFLLLASLVLRLDVGIGWALLGLAVSAVTHGWADRRRPLAWLARVTGHQSFYENKALNGAYLLDQSFHVFWLFVAALIITL
jgi:hypothetical protein